MKRKLFFWLDRLQIKRSERIAISALMSLMLILVTILTFADFTPQVDEDAYQELEAVFLERSQVRQAEHDAIMARYTPLENVSASVSVSDQQSAKSDPLSKVGESAKSESFEEPEKTEYAPIDTARININKATAEELQQLPGIGPAYSTRILEWRKEYGEFTSVDQLLEIRGIGPVRLEKIRPLIEL